MKSSRIALYLAISIILITACVSSGLSIIGGKQPAPQVAPGSNGVGSQPNFLLETPPPPAEVPVPGAVSFAGQPASDDIAAATDIVTAPLTQALITSAGGNLTSSDGVVTVIVPPAAVAAPVNMLYAPKANLSGITAFPQAIFAFELNAVDGNGQEVHQFAQPLQVQVKLPADVSEDVALYYYDTAQGAWVALPTTVDVQARMLIATTTHFTAFAVAQFGGPVITAISSNPGHGTIGSSFTAQFWVDFTPPTRGILFVHIGSLSSQYWEKGYDYECFSVSGIRSEHLTVGLTVPSPTGGGQTVPYLVWAYYRPYFPDTCPNYNGGAGVGEQSSSLDYGIGWSPADSTRTPTPTPTATPEPSKILSLDVSPGSGQTVEGPQNFTVEVTAGLDAKQAGNLYLVASNGNDPFQGFACSKSRISGPSNPTVRRQLTIPPPAGPATVNYKIWAIFYPGESPTNSDCPSSQSNRVERNTDYAINWITKTDWEVVGVQIIQVIQDTEDSTIWGDPKVKGSVSLVAGRKTLVRVFVKNGEDPADEQEVLAEVLVYRNASPLKDFLAIGNIVVKDGGVESEEKRKELKGTLNFTLPERNDPGLDQFHILLNPTGKQWETNYANDRFPQSGEISLDYHDGGELNISYVEIAAKETSWFGEKILKGESDGAKEVALMQKLYPLAPGKIKLSLWNKAFKWDQSLDTQRELDLLLIKMQVESGFSNKRTQLYGFYDREVGSRIGNDITKDGYLYGKSFPTWSTLQDSSGTDIHGNGVVVAGVEGTGGGSRLKDAQFTFAHEIGHNLNLRHPCQDDKWPSSQPKTCEYNNKGELVKNIGEIGEYGIDFASSTLSIVQRNAQDLMSWGSPANPWISPYHYKKLLSREGLGVVANTGFTSLNSASTSTDGYIMLTGLVSDTGSGELLEAYHLPTYNILTVSSSGTHALRFLDVAGNVLQEYAFTPEFNEFATVPFFANVAYPVGTATIQLAKESEVYDTLVVSPHTPTISLLSPNGGEAWNTQPVTITWGASDEDNDPLTYAILYSKDGGQTWLALDSGLKETTYTLDPTLIAGTDSGIIRVIATDGVNTAMDDSDATFSNTKKAPEATIFSPRDGASYRRGDGVLFDGQGYDMEDDILPGTALRWSSSIDGFLGTGDALQTYDLSEGVHTITLEVTDTQGNIGRASILVVVHSQSQTDLKPPITSIQLDGTKGNNDWFTSPVKVTLTASDSESGVRETQIRLNGGDWQHYQAPFTLADEGITSLEVRSVDNVGNIEPVQEIEIKIDTQPPKTTIYLSGTMGNNGWFITPVGVTFTVTDNVSGVSEAQYRIDGGEWQQYQPPFALLKEGVTNFEFRSIDEAGNVEPAQSQEIKIDTRPPEVDVWTDQSAYTRLEPFVVHYQVSDPVPGSGIDTVEANLDGQPVTSGEVIDLFWYSLGTHTVTVTATDLAGWTTAKQANFEVVADLDSLRATILHLRALGEIDSDGITNSLLAKVDGAIDAMGRGQKNAAINKLDALIHELEAQSGKHVSEQAAQLLIGDTQYVQAHLP